MTRTGTGFFDGSLWESSKRTSDASLKALINKGLENTSVTCVLAGTETYARRWVRYEIAKSLVRGNGLLTVRIDRKQDQRGYTCDAGLNPLACMGVYEAARGDVRLAELVNGRWTHYEDYQARIQLPALWRQPSSTTVVPLSYYGRCYCYVAENGSLSLARWIEAAAQDVGR
jgi:hypothetical protein